MKLTQLRWEVTLIPEPVIVRDNFSSRNKKKFACYVLQREKGVPIAIPPLAEQHRIVAKADELMTFCDTLKNCINTAQTTQVQLADCLAEQVPG
ncbi:MAG: hypothetical protein COB33_014605 [Thiotrichaceae bacterium]|nr:hypothetical protein [Thiotrichaceae bacterium]